MHNYFDTFNIYVWCRVPYLSMFLQSVGNHNFPQPPILCSPEQHLSLCQASQPPLRHPYTQDIRISCPLPSLISFLVCVYPRCDTICELVCKSLAGLKWTYDANIKTEWGCRIRICRNRRESPSYIYRMRQTSRIIRIIY